jgi:hypothetical protein
MNPALRPSTFEAGVINHPPIQAYENPLGVLPKFRRGASRGEDIYHDAARDSILYNLG